MYIWDERKTTVNNPWKQGNEKIGFLNRDNNTLKRVRKYFTMKSLILAQDER